ncbi:MAG: Peptidase M50 [Parcubacteria bacterium C7867-005]|nr:MAG: Peptidase M50 [Parcubacteria bacterium C7867-005]
MQLEFIFQIAILIMSVVIHEVSHGYAASLLGDQTARYQGRLTLNPFKHLEMVGSFFVPLVSYFFGGFIFGWAKPVPYNPHNLRPGRWSEAIVAGAGPASNLVLAIIFGLVIRFSVALGIENMAFLHVTALVVFVNLLLMVFNLVPIPPLDGSKLLFACFPQKMYQIRGFYERYSLILILIFIFVLWEYIAPLATLAFRIITGLSL